MPSLHVPEPFKPTLERIASMSDEDVQKVQEALRALKPHVKPESMAKSAVGKSDISGFDEIVQVLIGLSLTWVRFHSPMDEFVHEVSKAAKKDRSVLEDRLKALLSIDSLLLAARAFDIQHEYEKVFRSARIVTDIRPIFSTEGTETTGAMIVHNLNVTYFENNEFKEAIYALDDSDVVALKKVLERAELKTSVLEALIGKTGLPYFESKG
jgi:hypothetical protein